MMTTTQEALKMAIEALENMKRTYPYSPPCLEWEEKVDAHRSCKKAINDCKEALKQQAKQLSNGCGKCHACLVGVNDESGLPVTATRMILCPTCGNKRCPHASNHRYACTNSNEPNQNGSVYRSHPAKQWQGFSDDEILKMAIAYWDDAKFGVPETEIIDFARAIEAKIRGE